MTAIQQPTTHSASIGRSEFERAEDRTAHNYHPLPVVVAHAEGAWVTDVDGRRYLDLLAGYSALNFGHGHPRCWPPPAPSSTGSPSPAGRSARPARPVHRGARRAAGRRPCCR